VDTGGQRERPKVVIDASVAAKWVVSGEPWQEEARILEEKIAFGEVEAYAPQLFLYEVASVIFKTIRSGVLKISDGIEALNAIGQLGIKIQPAAWNDQAEILNIAVMTKLTVYENAKLITADSELKRRGESVAAILLLKELKI